MENGLEIKKFIKEINKSNIKNKKEIISYLNKIVKNNYISIFYDINHLKNTIYLINNHNSLPFNNIIKLAEKLYNEKILCNYTENDLKNFYNLLKNYLTIINNQDFNIHEYLLTFTIDICNLFENKTLANSIINRISNLKLENNPSLSLNDFYSNIKNYIIKSRSYYVDEHQYYANILDFINSISKIKTNEELLDIINKKITIDEAKLGIYNIDDNKLKELEKNEKKFNFKIRKYTK